MCWQRGLINKKNSVADCQFSSHCYHEYKILLPSSPPRDIPIAVFKTLTDATNDYYLGVVLVQALLASMGKHLELLLEVLNLRRPFVQVSFLVYSRGSIGVVASRDETHSMPSVRANDRKVNIQLREFMPVTVTFFIDQYQP
jgi:hypothetical protein